MVSSSRAAAFSARSASRYPSASSDTMSGSTSLEPSSPIVAVLRLELGEALVHVAAEHLRERVEGQRERDVERVPGPGRGRDVVVGARLERLEPAAEPRDERPPEERDRVRELVVERLRLGDRRPRRPPRAVSGLPRIHSLQKPEFEAVNRGFCAYWVMYCRGLVGLVQLESTRSKCSTLRSQRPVHMWVWETARWAMIRTPGSGERSVRATASSASSAVGPHQALEQVVGPQPEHRAPDGRPGWQRLGSARARS